VKRMDATYLSNMKLLTIKRGELRLSRTVESLESVAPWLITRNRG
jgi:hypothetical protein